MNDQENAFGLNGGATYLKETLEINDEQTPKLRSLRQYLRRSFNDISCFLMPHPGKKVTRIEYTGNWFQLEEDFVEQLRDLVTFLLAPQNLILKNINKDDVTSKEFFNYIQGYSLLYRSGDLPEPASLFETTINNFILNLITKKMAAYHNKIQSKKSSLMEFKEIGELHIESKNMAMMDSSVSKIGNPEHEADFQKRLDEQIEESFKIWSKDAEQDIEQRATIYWNSLLQERLNIYNDVVQIGKDTITDVKQIEILHQSARMNATAESYSSQKIIGSPEHQLNFVSQLNVEIDKKYREWSKDTADKIYLAEIVYWTEKLLDLEKTRTYEDLVELKEDIDEKLSKKEKYLLLYVKIEMKDAQTSLNDIKNKISWNLKIVLENANISVVNQCYMSYATKLWNLECSNQMIKLLRGNQNDVKNLENLFDGVLNLKEMPKILKDLKYYKLISDNYHLINLVDETSIIKKLNALRERSLNHRDKSIKAEQTFLKDLLNFLRKSHKLNTAPVSSLQLDFFAAGYLSFANLANNLKYVNVAKLIESSKLIPDHDYIFTLNEMHETIKNYIQDAVIITETKFDRTVLKIKGHHIVISQFLSKIERQLDTFEEIHFVGNDVVHIDKNLDNSIWNGTNILIISQAIIVHGLISWDVSGKSVTQSYSTLGFDSNGDGLPGLNGISGESGGNILIVAKEEIIGGTSWTIISNGGHASSGQDGGNGQMGKDGIGFTKAELSDRDTSNRLSKNNPGCKIKEHTVLSYGVIYNYYDDCPTANGQSVTYMDSSWSYVTSRYIFVTGSPGQQGANGGSAGRGAFGGFAGEISIEGPGSSAVRKVNNNGGDGVNGRLGKGGLGGFEGWDMGCVKTLTSRECDFLGNDGTMKLRIYKKNRGEEGTVYNHFRSPNHWGMESLRPIARVESGPDGGISSFTPAPQKKKIISRQL